MSKIYDKVCIVTGGGGGIGLGFCEALATAGARAVFVVDINIQSAKEAAKSLPLLATHPQFRCGFDAADVGKEEDLRRIILSAWKEFGSVDAYFSNAGIFTMGGISDREVTNEAWDTIWRVNVMSHVFAARHLFPLWREHNISGIFVITASAAGLLMQIGCLPYHVTKHAAVSVADWLAVEHCQDGVSVHCVCPQAVRTNMLTSSAGALLKNDKKNDLSNAGLAGRDGVAEPKDVAIATIKGIDAGTFLVLPHPQVKKYFVRKATNYERWIKGMGKVKKNIEAMLKESPPQSKL
mmetsp:Transcript_38998/g.81993  ORF Transcript_38998/g.81993 Transcript_38998/m.81993 type:complete len:294 (-) Transcript_38998:75-956(-)